jgi:ribosomal RNA-processing protein 36
VALASADALADLSTLPFGSLRKAQRTLAQASMETDDEASGSDDEDDGPTPAPAAAKGPAKEWSTRPRPDIAKRAHKHA